MTAAESIVLVLQIVLPVILIGRVAIVRTRSRLSWYVDLALAATYLAALGMATPMLVVPWYWPWACLGLLVVAVGLGAKRVGATEAGSPSGLWQRTGLVLRSVLVLLLAGVILLALGGRRDFDEKAVDLAFPLRAGTYLVANGGSSELLNAHLKTLQDERFSAYRGQSFAIDLVAIGRWGSRDSGIFPRDPSAYAVFGNTIHAPCAGTVVHARDGYPDRLGPGSEPATLEGNHVILACDPAWVLLAHMQEGSVRVTEGDSVLAGEAIGRVGNSGRSDEPHLHIHAQTPGSPAALLGGEPLPITFDQRSLVRNDRVRGS